MKYRSQIFAYSLLFLGFQMYVFSTGSSAQVVIDHRTSYEGLRTLLTERNWQSAKDRTWRIMLRKGDQNNDGTLTDPENASFPCEDLRILMDLWRKHFHASGGYDDILIPRFHNRAVSCNIWR